MSDKLDAPIATKNDVLAKLTAVLNGELTLTEDQLAAANMLLGYYKTVKAEGKKGESVMGVGADQGVSG